MEKPDGFDISEYKKYLNSDEWKAIAKKVKDRDGNKCAYCLSENNLNVHHLTYKHIYHEDEHLEDLVTLCESHHLGYHFVKLLEIERDEQIRKEERVQVPYECTAQYYDEMMEQGAEIENAIKYAYLDKDYSKDGPLDMCNYEVIDRVVTKWCEEVGFTETQYIGRQHIHDFFMMRRYEFLLKCINQGFTATQIAEKSNFSISWVRRYYKKKFLEDKLKEEKFIHGKEGDI